MVDCEAAMDALEVTLAAAIEIKVLMMNNEQMLVISNITNLEEDQWC